MSSPFVAEIRIFGFNFAPTGWALCDGQILPITQNTALFSLLGTTYGGNGQSTFALPDLQGRTPLMFGQSGGGSLYDLGQEGGVETVTLLQTEIPFHTHNLMTDPDDPAESNGPSNFAMCRSNLNVYGAASNLVQMAFQGLAPAGNSFPHNNMMPYLTLNSCIALQGVFPPRT